MAPVKIQIKFAKFLTEVNKEAVNAAVLAELGVSLYKPLNYQLTSG